MGQGNDIPAWPTVEVSRRAVPPSWAVMERFLIDVMNRAAVHFVERYTRPDGTLVWREEWPGMDGSDDGYESFGTFPLFYTLGGSEEVHRLARRQWNAVTWQFTQYGQIYRDFDGYYDWMHHGESSQYIYYFGLADPYAYQDRRRALRFAAMYIGEDAEAPNWDAERRMIRSPINGSRGPRFHMTAEDWVTHRPILAHYLSPYEDVPGLDPDDPQAIADWNDDAVFAEVLRRMNDRMVPGDVPLNLNATSLVTSAYLYTGEEKYRRWVLDYLGAWRERTDKNHGIMPDNVGPNGLIGERMAGKWWGGYYGWRWPHGASIILESTLIAGANALLLTGDASHLDLHRSQWDLLWSLGRERDGVFEVPWRHGERGWFQYRPPDPRYPIHVYYLTRDPADRERLERVGDATRWAARGGFGKGGQYAPGPWFAYAEGFDPEAPQRVLEATCDEVARRMERIRNDSGDPQEWDVHHWQDLNPVVCEALAQLTMGTPGAIYHGGLLHARVRYFDPDARRPGLPEHVAALVERIADDGVILHLVNTDAISSHDVLVQAGAFAEHQFTTVRNADDAADGGRAVNAPHLLVRLGPSAQARLRVGAERYVGRPTYDFPWQR
jgi:hypothetical protein